MTGGEIFFIAILIFLFFRSGPGPRSGGVVRLDPPTIPRPVRPPKAWGRPS